MNRSCARELHGFLYVKTWPLVVLCNNIAFLFAISTFYNRQTALVLIIVFNLNFKNDFMAKLPTQDLKTTDEG